MSPPDLVLTGRGEGLGWALAELPSAHPCCGDQKQPWVSSRNGVVEVRSSGAGCCWSWQCSALLTVPVLSACRMVLPPDTKAKAPLQQNKAATSAGVQVRSEEVGFRRAM